MITHRMTSLGRRLCSPKLRSSAIQLEKTLFFMYSKANISRQMCSAAAAASSPKSNFKDIAVTVPKPYVYHVELNRPQKLNAFTKNMWTEIRDCFHELSNDPDCRVIVLSAAGKHFSAGIDLSDMLKLGQEMSEIDDVGRKGFFMAKRIKLYQDGFTALETCAKPVIAAVHSACVGAGVDMITAADIRYCSRDAWFQVKEVDIGMAADVGTLQRLPKAIGSQSLARELCLTSRKFQSEEAHSCGLISKVFETKDALLAGAIELAADIASKSPVAVQATKKNMVFSLEHSNQEGLDQIREMSMLLLQSEDFVNAVMAQATKGEKPVFSKL